MKKPAWLDRAQKSSLLRNTLWMLLGQGARIPIQAIYFILIARALGASGYGAFVAVVSLVSILAPFSGLGSGNILIKNVARDPACFPTYWGKALLITSASGAIFTVGLAVLGGLFLPSSIPASLVLSVAVADLILARLGDVSILAFQSFQRLGRTSFLVILPSLSRLFMLLILLLINRTPSAEDWGRFYFLGVLLSAMIGIFLVNSELGKPRLNWSTLFTEMKEGFYFSISLASINVYNDIDKTILARYATLDAAGTYAAAYRLIDVAFLPVRSLLAAAYARFFQSGVQGMRGTLALAKSLLPFAMGYAALASLALFFCAPILPFILGEEYRPAVEALRWLSILPLLKGLQYFATDSLTGAGYQGVRSICQLVTAALNLAATLWLVPRYSWKGAAWASLGSDFFLVLAVWTVSLWLSRKESIATPGTPG